MEKQTISPEEVKHIRVINNLRRISNHKTREINYSKKEIARALYWSCNKTLSEVNELIEKLHDRN